MREKALNSLYVFNKAVLGMKDLTVDYHKPGCDAISAPGSRRNKHQEARDHLKTSTKTIGKRLWKAFRFLYGREYADEFEYPCAVVSSTSTNAKRMSRDAARYFNESPTREWLFPEVRIGEEWAKETRMLEYVEGGRVLRRAIIEFFGVGARASSRHYRGITLDDLHAVEEATDSPPAVEDVVNWYKHTDSLLIEPLKDEIDLVGTPSSLNPPDVFLYAEQAEPDRYVEFRQPCYKEDGSPAWPERFPRHVLEGIRRKQGDFLFALQYLLVYIDPKSIEFRSDYFPRYTIAGSEPSELFILEDSRKYYFKQLASCMTVDLAGWRGDGDDNAILAAGRAADEMTFILEAWRARCTPDAVIDQIITIHKRWCIPVVGVEEVALQQYLSYYLLKRIAKERLSLRVVPVKPGRMSKDGRIRGMQPAAKQRQFAIRDDLVHFLEEATRFPKGKKHLLDCFAYLPQVWSLPLMEDFSEREEEMRREYLKAVGGYA